MTPLSKQTSPVAPLSQKTSPVAPLSQWLQLMLTEIARKREELERAHAEAARRSAESDGRAGGTGAEDMPT
jgi:hypothetical protein